MSKKYEYKVGDKVRVRDWADMEKEYSVITSAMGGIASPVYFSPEMRKFCGKVFTVREIENFTDRIIRLAGIDDWVFGYEHLILVESAPQKKPDEKTRPVVSEIHTDAERIAALEAEIKKLRQENPWQVVEDKTKPEKRNPIFPRIMENSMGHLVVAKNAEELDTVFGLIGLRASKEGRSVLNWHHWSGGKCPVPSETQVVVYLRDGGMGGMKAGALLWHHDPPGDPDRGGDIVAYAVVEPPKLEGT